MTSRPDAEHYSYAVYADAATAERFDAARFGGPIGELVAETQERTLVEFVAPRATLGVLDVGTGTGRAALLLARRGARVTGIDASREMLAVAARRAASERLAVTFARGDAQALPFPDRSFDTVVCLRVIMHTPDWRRSVGELCRVARRQVVVDYPALASFAALQSLARRAAVAAGRRKVEAYRVFTDRAMREAFAAEGFHVSRACRQFVLPIALHKAIGSRRFTARVEGALAAAGLLRLAGSPVTALAQRFA